MSSNETAEPVLTRINLVQNWIYNKFPQIPWNPLKPKPLALVFHLVAFLSLCVFFTGFYAEFRHDKTPHRVQGIFCFFLFMVYLMAFFYSPRKIRGFTPIYTGLLSLDKMVLFRCFKVFFSILLYAFGIENYPYLFSVCSCSFSGFSLSMMKFYGVNFDNYGLCEDFVVALFVSFLDNFVKWFLHYFLQGYRDKGYGDRYIYSAIFFITLLFAVFTRYSPELNPIPTTQNNKREEELMESGRLQAKRDLVLLQITEANEELASLQAKSDWVNLQITEANEALASLQARSDLVHEEIVSLQARREVVSQDLVSMEEKRKEIQGIREATVTELETLSTGLTDAMKRIRDSILFIASPGVNNNPLLEIEKYLPQMEIEMVVEAAAPEVQEEAAPEVQEEEEAAVRRIRESLLLIASSSVEGVMNLAWPEIEGVIHPEIEEEDRRCDQPGD